MKTSKILFLIINLVFLACGKKESHSSGMSFSEMDDDGDFITNFYDESPYIAHNPIHDLNMSVNDNNKQYDFDMNIEQKDELYKYIALNLKKKNLNFKVDFELLSKSLPSELFQKNKVSFEIESEQKYKNFNFELYQGHKLINPIQTAELGVTYLELNKLPAKSQILTLKMKDFEFEREYQTYQYSDFIKSLKAKTYTLSVLSLDNTAIYHVSKKLNLAQALTKIGYPEHFIFDLKTRNFPLLTEDIATLHADSSAWVLVKNTDSYLLVEITKKMVNDYRTKVSPLKTQTNQIDYQVNFNSNRIFKLDFTPKGELTLYQYSKQVHRGRTRIYRRGHRDAMREERRKCKYTVHTITPQKIAITAGNFTSYYDIFVNHKKISPKLVAGRLNLKTNESIENLSIKIKQNYRQNYLQGITDGPGDKCGKKAIQSNGRSLRYRTNSVSRIKAHQIGLEIKQYLRPH